MHKIITIEVVLQMEESSKNKVDIPVLCEVVNNVDNACCRCEELGEVTALADVEAVGVVTG